MDPGTGTTLFVGVRQTVEKYPLVIERSWNMPCLLHVAGTGWHVKGEIYDVDDEKMKFLDYFEDHPEMYTRTVILAEYTDSNVTKSSAPKSKENQPNTHSECWCYFYNDRDSVRDLPHIDEYDTKGEHGLEYDASIDAEFDDNKKSW
ncbi:gamma-glutamylaminecyclotransferase-like [Magallana gigas]|uniref:gamma-glutamylaminecyclotransferase-like n=1 Tax=Magallana gigas TaxID=29159 RepID=UPI003341A8A0